MKKKDLRVEDTSRIPPFIQSPAIIYIDLLVRNGDNKF